VPDRADGDRRSGRPEFDQLILEEGHCPQDTPLTGASVWSMAAAISSKQIPKTVGAVAYHVCRSERDGGVVGDPVEPGVLPGVTRR
jgi:hypothetical protein